MAFNGLLSRNWCLGIGARQIVVCMAILGLLTGCAGLTRSKALGISATTLEGMGNQFLQVGQIYDLLLEQGKVSQAEYRNWAKFANEFKQWFPVATRLWAAARAANDDATQQTVSAAIVSMAARLSAIAAEAYAKFETGRRE